MTRVVVALDSFKGSIGAAAAVDAVARGWREVDPDAVVRNRPMADGGEGTLDAFAAAVPEATRMPVTVRGPHGRDVAASWLLLPDREGAGASEGTGATGVVELASTSGIELLGAERRPWDADTFGFGQAIAAALDHDVDRLVLGIGSSASTDGGVGLLVALGAAFVDADGRPVAPGARGMAEVVAVDLTGLRPLPPGGATVLTDVTNPLVGPQGAAAVFGPQKGVTGDEVPVVDAALARLAGALGGDPAAPGAGAAGGTGFALARWGAQLRPGADDVAALIGLDEALADAALVVTGEGSFDGQSAAGKVPSLVAARARAAGVPVALVAGRVAPDADTSAFVAVVALAELAGSAEASFADPAPWLRAAGRYLASR